MKSAISCPLQGEVQPFEGGRRRRVRLQETATLRLATVGLDQFSRRPNRQTKSRPLSKRVASFDRKPGYACGNKIVESGSAADPRGPERGSELRNHPPMRRYGNPFARLDPAHKPAQIDFQLPNTCRRHLADYSHM
jgi:hypothetical protein